MDKLLNWIIGALVVLGIIGVIIWVSSQETQYTKDYNSSRNKTWDQMTPGERKVTKDEIEWYIKKSGVYD